jgi:hypothetical protein
MVEVAVRGAERMVDLERLVSNDGSGDAHVALEKPSPYRAYPAHAHAAGAAAINAVAAAGVPAPDR